VTRPTSQEKCVSPVMLKTNIVMLKTNIAGELRFTRDVGL
jgi:hypothetical protein